MRRNVVSSALLAVCFGACSLPIAPRTSVAQFDLGPEPPDTAVVATRLPCVVVVYDPTAPAWLDSRFIHYRLAYQDPARIQRYLDSQWALSPIQLFGDRMRHRLAAVVKGGVPDYGIDADFWVRLTLDDFAQDFSAPTASRGTVRITAVLLKGRRRTFVAQDTFVSSVVAPTPDARGGVTALSQASDDTAAAIVKWVVEKALSAGKASAEPT